MSTSKSLKNHLSVLEARHRELDKAINEEYDHYDSDEIVKKTSGTQDFPNITAGQYLEQRLKEIGLRK